MTSDQFPAQFPATTNPVGLIALSTSANWGRAAHETGHFIIEGPNVGIVEEDLYSADGVSPDEAVLRSLISWVTTMLIPCSRLTS